MQESILLCKIIKRKNINKNECDLLSPVIVIEGMFGYWHQIMAFSSSYL